MRSLLTGIGQVGAVSIFIYNLKTSYDMSQTKLLHEAITDGDEIKVNRLLQDGANVNAVHSRELPFTRALELCNSNIAELLLSNQYFDLNARNQMDRRPLFYAAKCNKLSMVGRLTSQKCDINVSDIRGVTALGATGWYDAWQTADLLIKRGADVNKVDIKGESVLYRACSNVSIKVVKLLLDNYSDVNIQTNHLHSSPETTAIMAAIPSKYQIEIQGRRMTDMIDIVKLLLANDCDLYIAEKCGRTVLHRAVELDEYHTACLLMEHGCDINVTDKKGLSPLHLAISPSCPRYELALCLLYYGCDANQKLRDEKTGSDVLPFTLVLQSKTTNSESEKHRQKLIDALSMATDFSNCDLTSIMCANSTRDASDNPESISNRFDQSLLFSFQNQCRLTIRRLLGPDILPKIELLPFGWNLKRYLALGCDYNKYHPLTIAEFHTAVLDNEIETLEIMLSSKYIDVNTPLKNKTPLTLATYKGHIESAMLLLGNGADVNKMDPCGQTAMHVAAVKGQTELIQLLLAHGSDNNCKNSRNNTPLMEAAAMGQFDAASLLCVSGGDPSAVGDVQIPAIHFAAGSGHVLATATFSKAGADINAIDSNGNTALHIAASRGFLYLRNGIRLPALYAEEALEMMDAVKMILVDGDPKYTTKENVDHVTVIQCLLDSGCDPRIRNQELKNALDVSREFGFHEVNRLLQDWINQNSG